MAELETAETVVTKCFWCDRELDDEEYESPQVCDGEVTCDECYRRKYCFDCCRCQEYEDNEVRDKPGRLLVVFDADEAGLPVSGLYEIVEWPYYTSDMFSMWFNREAIRYVGYIHFSNYDIYPCGHLCERCAQKARDEAKFCPCHRIPEELCPGDDL